MMTDEEIKAMVGHPDCLSPQYIDGFLRGYRACEQGLDTRPFTTSFCDKYPTRSMCAEWIKNWNSCSKCKDKRNETQETVH